jgi:hypothetical protein
MKNLIRTPHAAGGYVLKLSEQKPNTRFGVKSAEKIISVIQNENVDMVFQYQNRKGVFAQYLNGVCIQIL